MKILEIINKTRKSIECKFLEKVAKEALTAAGVDQRIIIELVFLSDREIKKLNKKYRKRNKITDVLSFPLLNLKKEEKFFVLPESNDRCLGEIFISYNQAVRQAKKYNHSLQKEFTKLLIHGILHLLGYDHIEEKDRKKMETMEEKIINNLCYCISKNKKHCLEK